MEPSHIIALFRFHVLHLTVPSIGMQEKGHILIEKGWDDADYFQTVGEQGDVCFLTRLSYHRAFETLAIFHMPGNEAILAVLKSCVESPQHKHLAAVVRQK